MSVSAGNEGPECETIQTPPAFEPTVITVGAVDLNDNLALSVLVDPSKLTESLIENRILLHRVSELWEPIWMEVIEDYRELPWPVHTLEDL